MDSIEPPADGKGPSRPLGYNLALLAHLIYLARRCTMIRAQPGLISLNSYRSDKSSGVYRDRWLLRFA